MTTSEAQRLAREIRKHLRVGQEWLATGDYVKAFAEFEQVQHLAFELKSQTIESAA